MGSPQETGVVAPDDPAQHLSVADVLSRGDEAIADGEAIDLVRPLAGQLHVDGGDDPFVWVGPDLAPRIAAPRGRSEGFWRVLGELPGSIWLWRAKLSSIAAVYGTEGQRFESSRARFGCRPTGPPVAAVTA
jgi:hypothetical protein